MNAHADRIGTPSRPRLFIPGPTEIAPEVAAAQTQRMIGHRGEAFRELYRAIQPKLQRVLGTRGPAYISTSSATGVMELAVRNLTRPGRRVLSVACGAFGERWHKIATSNGREAVLLAAEWGEPNLPEHLAEALRGGPFDLITVVHNETSTGVMNPLADQLRTARELAPDTLVAVDTVSSLGMVSIPVDELGIDLCLAGSQKGLALPPGIAVFTASDRARARAAEVPDRGTYFDLLDFHKNHEKGQTPSTPAISLLYALDLQLDRILAEGLEARHARHLAMAERCRAWARERFALFPRDGYASVSLTAIRNTRRIDVADLNRFLQAQGLTLGNGYGKMKDLTFRIAHMGECTLEALDDLLAQVDGYLGKR